MNNTFRNIIDFFWRKHCHDSPFQLVSLFFKSVHAPFFYYTLFNWQVQTISKNVSTLNYWNSQFIFRCKSTLTKVETVTSNSILFPNLTIINSHRTIWRVISSSQVVWIGNTHVSMHWNEKSIIYFYQNVKDDDFTQFCWGVQIRGGGSISASEFGLGVQI